MKPVCCHCKKELAMDALPPGSVGAHVDCSHAATERAWRKLEAMIRATYCVVRTTHNGKLQFLAEGLSFEQAHARLALERRLRPEVPDYELAVEQEYRGSAAALGEGPPRTYRVVGVFAGNHRRKVLESGVSRQSAVTSVRMWQAGLGRPPGFEDFYVEQE